MEDEPGAARPEAEEEGPATAGTEADEAAGEGACGSLFWFLLRQPGATASMYASVGYLNHLGECEGLLPLVKVMVLEVVLEVVLAA